MARSYRRATGLFFKLVTGALLFLVIFILFGQKNQRDSCLEILILPPPPREFPVVVLDEHERNHLFSSQDTQNENKFCISMLTHRGRKTPVWLLHHYLKMKVVECLVLWWNKDGYVPKPEDLVHRQYADKLTLVQLYENNLLLRFQDDASFQTQGIFTIDDDILIHELDLLYAFRIWRRHPHAIVGFYKRLHVEVSPGEYEYIWNPGSNYSMVLTGAAFYHKNWLGLFQQGLPQALNMTVGAWKNCEDIAFNFFVASRWPEPATIYVRQRYKIHHFSRLKGALSGRQGHAAQRNLCLTYFSRYFAEMPLRVTKTEY